MDINFSEESLKKLKGVYECLVALCADITSSTGNHVSRKEASSLLYLEHLIARIETAFEAPPPKPKVVKVDWDNFYWDEYDRRRGETTPKNVNTKEPVYFLEYDPDGDGITVYQGEGDARKEQFVPFAYVERIR